MFSVQSLGIRVPGNTYIESLFIYYIEPILDFLNPLKFKVPACSLGSLGFEALRDM